MTSQTDRPRSFDRDEAVDQTWRLSAKTPKGVTPLGASTDAAELVHAGSAVMPPAPNTI